MNFDAPRMVLGKPHPELVPNPADAIDVHRGLPGYRPTPLVDAPGIAEAAGVGRVLVKDESERFGLPAFKYLGASYAISSILGGGTLDELRNAARARGVETLITATDGNHGRGVARLAAQLRLQSRIHAPRAMTPARRQAIAGEGATLMISDGDYEAAVIDAAADARSDPGALLLADTDSSGADPIPGLVIDGYGTLFAEAGAQLAERGLSPDLLIVQMGCGGFASAGIRWASARGIPSVGVEPKAAACVTASLLAGELTEITAGHTTIACLEAGAPSSAAWPTLVAGLSGVVCLDDAEADEAARLLARDGIRAGEAGAAGVAGLIALMRDPACDELAQTTGARDARTVLVVVTEGPTDPERYAAILSTG